ncbi:hypothetical protein Tco_0969795 [Tanacetum coccineum]
MSSSLSLLELKKSSTGNKSARRIHDPTRTNQFSSLSDVMAAYKTKLPACMNVCCQQKEATNSRNQQTSLGTPPSTTISRNEFSQEKYAQQHVLETFNIIHSYQAETMLQPEDKVMPNLNMLGPLMKDWVLHNAYGALVVYEDFGIHEVDSINPATGSESRVSVHSSSSANTRLLVEDVATIVCLLYAEINLLPRKLNPHVVGFPSPWEQHNSLSL